MLIENEGLFFRGPRLNEATEIWHDVNREWVPYRRHGNDRDCPFGVEIDDERAESLKTDNWDAEHYRYYDFPPWSQYRA